MASNRERRLHGGRSYDTLDRAGQSLSAFGEQLNSTMGRSLQASLRTANQALAEWSQEFQQGIGIAEQALAAFQSTAQQVLAGYSAAIGTSIADSLVYGSSIQTAMDRALKAVTANIAGQAATQAIYSTALGFLRLAEWDLAAAANAFEAAAVFASVAGMAGVAGASLPSGPSVPGAVQAGASASPSRPISPAASAGSSSYATAQGVAGGRVQVMVMGEAQAAAWLTRVINTGVKYHDLELTATRSKKPTYSPGH
jgi:phage tail protein X